MHKKFGMYGVLIGFYYIIQFVMCVGCCNFYSDISRYYICVRKDGSLIQSDAASAVLDQAIYLLGIFHIIEWIRTTILLMIICIGVGLMKIWYFTMINAFYGFVCLVITHQVYVSADGKACGLA